MKITVDFKCFHYFNFEKSIPKNWKCFLKIEGSLFIVGSTMVENAVFPDKTALLKANVKTNRMESSNNGSITKNGIFLLPIFHFSKLNLKLRASYK